MSKKMKCPYDDCSKTVITRNEPDETDNDSSNPLNQHIREEHLGVERHSEYPRTNKPF